MAESKKDDLRKEVGLRIKTMRLSRDMTQQDLARMADLTGSAIAMYETGKRLPDLETIDILADAFNVPRSAILPPDTDVYTPQTPEAEALAKGVDKLPQEQREKLMNVVNELFEMFMASNNKKGNK